MPLSPEDRAHSAAMLRKHQWNLRRLEGQAADYGASAVPLQLLNGIANEQAAIIVDPGNRTAIC